MTNKEASEKIMQIVKMVSEENEKAYHSFSSRRREIERSASKRSIDLFGETAVYEVRDVVEDTRDIAEEFYASNQSLVRMIDDECKPLLDFSPYKKVVADVAKIIEKLNEASSININFGASLNHGSMNDVASVHYEPSIESKMIQKFWEQKAHFITESEEEKAVIKAKKQEEKKKKEEDQKERHEERLKYEAALQKHNEWEEECKNIKKLQQEWKDKKVIEKRKQLEKEAETKHNSKVLEINNIIDDMKAEKQELEKEISALGFFAISAKSEKRKRIKEIMKAVSQAENKLTIEDMDYEAERSRIGDKILQYRKSLKDSDSGYVLPEEPEVLDEVFEPNPYYDGRDYSDRDVLRETILEILEEVSGKMTITQIMEYGSIDARTSLVSSVIRELLQDNMITCIKDTRKIYYTI